MAMSINWYSAGATALVLFIALAIVGAMFFMIKLTNDDSEKYKELKEMVETLFGTPAHLRPSQSSSGADGGSKESAAQSAAALESFVESCPACGETVTELHKECPSCGLRLL